MSAGADSAAAATGASAGSAAALTASALLPAPTGGELAIRLIAWQRRAGRHDLPWQGRRDPYRIWLSEVMLQQTQVATVIPYYLRFVQTFPDVFALAAASLDDVMRLWSGLGYYSRARNLHRCACQVVAQYAGRFPDDAQQLARLPGIGRSTAGAIAALAHGRRAAILDGNARRVLCRLFAVEGWPGERAVEQRLWRIAERELPETGIEAYTQGLMDLGATVCVRGAPHCARCPLATLCAARRDGVVHRLPSPRPSRPSPQRTCTMFAIRCEGRWLVEKRPAPGIWGGLWSLPEQGERGRREALRIVARHGLALATTAPLEPFVHAFTHFRLRIEPLLCEATGPAAPATVPGTAWLPQAEVAAAALPGPVKRLLLDLGDEPAGAGPVSGLESADAARGGDARATGARARGRAP